MPYDVVINVSQFSHLRVVAAVFIFFASGLRGSSLGGDDTDFVKKAAKGNLAEIELGRLAVRKAVSPEVKGFGNRIDPRSL